jgi:hypothetical protein
MNELISTIRKVLPEVIKEVNDVRIPALEKAWGRDFKEEMKNENQVTVEIAKNYARPLNNALYRQVSKILPNYEEQTINGSDYVYEDILIEDKNSFSDSNSWVGNGFVKTPVHLLKKFKVDENGRIIEAFVALVDLSKCKSSWSDRNINTNRSVISFTLDDMQHIQVIYGSIERKKKYLSPIMEKI